MNEIAFLKRMDDLRPCHGWGTRHALALLVLDAATKPIRHRDLAREMEIPKASLTRTGDMLAHAGLIEKRHNGADKRDAWFTITDKGRALVAQIRGEELQQERAA